MTSSNPGTCAILSRISGASRYSDSVSPLCKVYWYWLFDGRPPMLRFWMLWKNACMPGTWVPFWRRRAITTVAESRCFLGFNAMNSLPLLVVALGPPAPTVLLMYSTAGSRLRMSANSF